MFMKRQPLSLATVANIPRVPGVYIVYRRHVPVYVGRSRCDIRERLRRHVTGIGNRGIARAMQSNVPLEVEYQWLNSPEQAEAVLIRELGTASSLNLRRETDPGDW
jgi:hypothetical protein